jgi:polysaccharide pyruvyl transferase WcaK-like protein
MGGYTKDDVFGFRDRYIEFIYRVIDLMIKEKHVRVLLVPHCLGSSPESDSDVSARLYDELKGKYPGKIGLIRGRYTTAEMKYVIGRCVFFIGSRMHACIGSLSQGIPAVSVAYSRKFVGVLETLGVAELVVDPRVLSTDEMLNIIEDRYTRRREFQTHLEARMPEVRERILNLIPEICNDGVAPAVPVSGMESHPA